MAGSWDEAMIADPVRGPTGRHNRQKHYYGEGFWPNEIVNVDNRLPGFFSAGAWLSSISVYVKYHLKLKGSQDDEPRQRIEARRVQAKVRRSEHHDGSVNFGSSLQT